MNIKNIIMLNVKEDLEVNIDINENIIGVTDRYNNRLYFKIHNRNDIESINKDISRLINGHFEKGYVISSMK